jgi:hypothetical protein
MRARHNKHQLLISHAAAYREKRPRLEAKEPSGALRIAVRLLRPCTDIPLAPDISANERPHRHAMMSQQQYATQDTEAVDECVQTS